MSESELRAKLALANTAKAQEKARFVFCQQALVEAITEVCLLEAQLDLFEIERERENVTE